MFGKISSVLVTRKPKQVKNSACEMDKTSTKVADYIARESLPVSSLPKLIESPVLKMWARRFKTGTLETLSSSIVNVFNDRIQYVLRNHPDGGSVNMIMYFAHFQNPRISGNVLSFQLGKTMCHFPSFYDPRNPTHVLAVNFYANEADKLPTLLRRILQGKMRISNLSYCHGFS